MPMQPMQPPVVLANLLFWDRRIVCAIDILLGFTPSALCVTAPFAPRAARRAAGALARRSSSF